MSSLQSFTYSSITCSCYVHASLYLFMWVHTCSSLLILSLLLFLSSSASVSLVIFSELVLVLLICRLLYFFAGNFTMSYSPPSSIVNKSWSFTEVVPLHSLLQDLDMLGGQDKLFLIDEVWFSNWGAHRYFTYQVNNTSVAPMLSSSLAAVAWSSQHEAELPIITCSRLTWLAMVPPSIWILFPPLLWLLPRPWGPGSALHPCGWATD